MTDPGGPSFRVAARVSRAVAALYLWAACAFFVLAVAGLAAEIVMRYVFGAPMAHVHEAITIAFVHVFFLGAAALYARNEDIVLEFFADLFPARGRALLILTVYAGVAATAWLVFENAVILAQAQSHLLTPSLRVPQSVQIWPLAIAAGSILYFSLVEAWACALWIATGRRPVVFRSAYSAP